MSSRAGSVTRRNCGAVDVRDAVVLGEPLVDERVIRRQQIEHAAIFVDDAVEEQLDFALERLAQVVVEIRETD